MWRAKWDTVQCRRSLFAPPILFQAFRWWEASSIIRGENELKTRWDFSSLVSSRFFFLVNVSLALYYLNAPRYQPHNRRVEDFTRAYFWIGRLWIVICDTNNYFQKKIWVHPASLKLLNSVRKKKRARVIGKEKERKKTKIKRGIIFAWYFGLQHKPSTGAIKEKWVQIKDERYICEIWIHSKQKMIGY